MNMRTTVPADVPTGWTQENTFKKLEFKIIDLLLFLLFLCSQIDFFIDNWFYFLANANFGVPVNHCFYCVSLQCQNCMFLITYKFQKIETVWFFNGFEYSKRTWKTIQKNIEIFNRKHHVYHCFCKPSTGRTLQTNTVKY